MAEKLDLTTPTPSIPGVNNYTVDKLILDNGGSRIDVFLLANNGEQLRHSYYDSEADSLMVSLNKADLSTNSLQRRILQRLINDGVLIGSVSGTPD